LFKLHCSNIKSFNQTKDIIQNKKEGLAMKKILDAETLKFKILQPIVTVFITFFLIILFSSFYFEEDIIHNSENTLFYYLILIVLFISLFLVTKFYITKFSNRLVNTYNENLKDLKFNEHYLKTLEDSSPNLILSTIGKDIEKVNKTFLNFTQHKNLESFHTQYKCISDLFIKRKGYLEQYIDGEYWIDYVLKRPYLLHKTILKKENSEHIFIVNSRKLSIDGKERAMFTLNDITEFANLQKRFELAINSTRDGLWDWNLTTNEVYFSPQWKKMLGYEDNELENIFPTWKDRVHDEDRAQTLFDIQQNIDGKTQQYVNKHRLQHKNGSWVWILDRGQTIFDENNQPIRMVGFHTDITEKTLIEEELHDKDEMMIAQSRNAAMGEMISMIAHQWRQPLSVISMGANNILADVELEMIDKDSLKEVSDEIIIQTNELSKTIDDFREFFKPKKKKEIVSVHDVFEDALNIIGKSLENNDITLNKKFHSKKQIKTHSRELMQVILNILKNAKEILHENKIKNKEILISTIDDEDGVKIEICDNAGGIPQWVIPKIFDPYFSTKNDKTGTGLGLYMCKTIVEKHLHGTIHAFNNNNGACFKIILKDKKI